jgi:hypothetical protein
MSVGNHQGDYLRVLTPITSDGISPVVENDRIKYREDHLPLTAKKMLEAKNEKLPTGLRKKIEVVSATAKPVIKQSPKPKQVIEEVEQEIDDELAEDPDTEAEAEQEPEKPKATKKGKGGRPKKASA